MKAGRRLFWMLLAGLLSTMLGCRNHSELVESELRARDIQLRELTEEFAKSQAYNDTLQRELTAVRTGQPITPETAASSFGVKTIALGRGTGGYDADGIPGDESLYIHLEPRDCDGHSIKAPGVLHVIALEKNLQGLKLPLCSWEVGPDQLRQSWKQGLLTTGYFVILPWKKFPHCDQLRVVVRLTTPDGRVYETDKDVPIRLIPNAPLSKEKDEPSRNVAVAGHWQPASLQGVVKLGEPVPRPAPEDDPLTRYFVPEWSALP